MNYLQAMQRFGLTAKVGESVSVAETLMPSPGLRSPITGLTPEEWQEKFKRQVGLSATYSVPDMATQDIITTTNLTKLEDMLKSAQTYLAERQQKYQTNIRDYNFNHMGGQSPDAYAAIQAGVQQQISDAQYKISVIQDKIYEVKAGKAAEVKPLTAAESAAEAQKAAESYRKSMFLIMQPGYDYGTGAARRNILYSGMGDSMNRSDGGLTFSAPSRLNRERPDLSGLSINILDSVTKGIISSLPAAGKEILPGNISQIAAQFGINIPTVNIPNWVQPLVSGAKNQINIDRAKAALQAAEQQKQYQAETPAPRGSQTTKINWVYVGGGVAALALIVYMVKK